MENVKGSGIVVWLLGLLVLVAASSCDPRGARDKTASSAPAAHEVGVTVLHGADGFWSDVLVERIEDEHRGVACWIVEGRSGTSISCLPYDSLRNNPQ